MQNEGSFSFIKNHLIVLTDVTVTRTEGILLYSLTLMQYVHCIGYVYTPFILLKEKRSF